MTTPATPTAPEAAQPHFAIQRIFLKGTSLEVPMGAMLFLEKEAPALTMNLQVNNAQLADGVFECAVRATLSANFGEKTGFLLEVEQAGIFEARNLSAEEMANVKEISAPTILAPYLRAQLADILTRATLAPFYMPEINWTQMAMQAREAAKAQQLGVTIH